VIFTILLVVCYGLAFLGLVVAAKGAAKTQAVFRSANEHDLVIDIFAWFDRKFLGGGKPEKPQLTPAEK
jgi:hypothetical protein